MANGQVGNSHHKVKLKLIVWGKNMEWRWITDTNENNVMRYDLEKLNTILHCEPTLEIRLMI